MNYHYKESEMLYKYTWKAKDTHDNPKVIGGIERKELNRTEGWEVLPFIQKISALIALQTKEDCRKVEKMIHATPGHIKMRDDVENGLITIGKIINHNFFS